MNAESCNVLITGDYDMGKSYKVWEIIQCQLKHHKEAYYPFGNDRILYLTRYREDIYEKLYLDWGQTLTISDVDSDTRLFGRIGTERLRRTSVCAEIFSKYPSTEEYAKKIMEILNDLKNDILKEKK